jgi:endonuclease/exonuclease/phosphatase family metal-dependent hydrolase
MFRFAHILPILVGLGLTAGCGLIKTGYAPERAHVHQGRGQVAYAPAAGDSITVVCWNIQYGRKVRTALAEIRADSMLARADVLLLQEMDTDGVRLLADSLGFNFVYGPASVSPKSKDLFGNAVLSRWPIMDHRIVVLPHETLLTGHRRIAVSADIDLGGRTLRAVSLHTATMVMDQDKRLEQAAAVRDSLGDFAGPVVMGGDFNTVSEYEVTLLRRTMRRMGLETVRLPEGPTISNRFKKMPGEIPVLDHLFVRDLVPGSRGVVEGATASDHYPIWAVVGLPPPAPE